MDKLGKIRKICGNEHCRACMDSECDQDYESYKYFNLTTKILKTTKCAKFIDDYFKNTHHVLRRMIQGLVWHCIHLAQMLDKFGCGSAMLKQAGHCIHLAQILLNLAVSKKNKLLLCCFVWHFVCFSAHKLLKNRCIAIVYLCYIHKIKNDSER